MRSTTEPRGPVGGTTEPRGPVGGSPAGPLLGRLAVQRVPLRQVVMVACPRTTTPMAPDGMGRSGRTPSETLPTRGKGRDSMEGVAVAGLGVAGSPLGAGPKGRAAMEGGRSGTARCGRAPTGTRATGARGGSQWRGAQWHGSECKGSLWHTVAMGSDRSVAPRKGTCEAPEEAAHWLGTRKEWEASQGQVGLPPRAWAPAHTKWAPNHAGAPRPPARLPISLSIWRGDYDPGLISAPRRITKSAVGPSAPFGTTPRRFDGLIDPVSIWG